MVPSRTMRASQWGYGSLQPSITPFPGAMKPSSGTIFEGTRHAHKTKTHMQKTVKLINQ